MTHTKCGGAEMNATLPIINDKFFFLLLFSYIQVDGRYFSSLGVFLFYFLSDLCMHLIMRIGANNFCHW